MEEIMEMAVKAQFEQFADIKFVLNKLKEHGTRLKI